MSAIGLPGSSQFCDRFMETINNTQAERRGKFSAFDRALDFTEHMVGLMHVTHALEVKPSRFQFIRVHQYSSEFICAHHSSSDAICVHQRSSVFIRVH
jgi:hypothetical protein